MRTTAIVLAICTAAMSACHQKAPLQTTAPPLAPTTTALNTERRENVLRAIKADLRNYFAYQAVTEAAGAANNACKGAVSLRIKSVTFTLTSISQFDENHKIVAAIPIGMISPSVSIEGGDTSKSTWRSSFVLEPEYEAEPKIPVSDPLPGTFYAALRADRESMLATSDEKPCFRFPKEQKNSIEAGFQVVRPISGGLKFSFFIFALDNTIKNTSDATNTILVQYEAIGAPIIDPVTKKVTRGDPRFNAKVDKQLADILRKAVDAANHGEPVPED